MFLWMEVNEFDVPGFPGPSGHRCTHSCLEFEMAVRFMADCLRFSGVP